MRTRKADRARNDGRALIGVLVAGVFLGGAVAVLLREAGAWMDPNGAEAAVGSFVSRAKDASATSNTSSASHATAAKNVDTEAPAKTVTVNHANDAAATQAGAKNATTAKNVTAAKPAKPVATAKNATPAKGPDATTEATQTVASSQSNESGSVKRIRAAVEASAAAQVQAATPIEEQIQYQYNALGRRDPFEAMVGNFVGDDVGGDAPVDVGGMKVVGIVWGADSFALVEDGSGNSLILRRGDKVMNGFVEDLKRDAVVVKLNMDGLTQSVAIPLTRKGDQSNGTR